MIKGLDKHTFSLFPAGLCFISAAEIRSSEQEQKEENLFNFETSSDGSVSLCCVTVAAFHHKTTSWLFSSAGFICKCFNKLTAELYKVRGLMSWIVNKDDLNFVHENRALLKMRLWDVQSYFNLLQFLNAIRIYLGSEANRRPASRPI